jgi:hypothetical protein
MILDDYWKATLPQIPAPLEAEAFARTASASAPGVPHLYEVLGFERAVCATLTGGEARVVTFAAEPRPRALAAGRLAGRGANSGRYETRPAPYGRRPPASTSRGWRRRVRTADGPAQRCLAAQPRTGSWSEMSEWVASPSRRRKCRPETNT